MHIEIPAAFFLFIKNSAVGCFSKKIEKKTKQIQWNEVWRQKYSRILKLSGFSCRFLENLPFLCLIAADSFSYKRLRLIQDISRYSPSFLKQENSNVNLDQINQNMCILLCHRLLAKRPIQSKQQCIATQGHRKGGTGGGWRLSGGTAAQAAGVREFFCHFISFFLLLGWS